MSKSFHQKPEFLPEADSHVKNYFKRYANKKVRKSKTIDNGGQYKKLCNTYMTGDYKLRFVSKRLLLDSYLADCETEELLKSG